MTMRHDRSLIERSQKIDHCLLSWLESKDRDIERKRLEKLVRDYLCVATHNEKFACPQTSAVIYKNTVEQTEFAGDRAAHAFATIARYASNLLHQPWRTEFHEIKLYSGFYKHEVGELLTDAVKMFEAMGYHYDGRTTLRLPGPVDPDLVLTVCRDSIMAKVECAIMQQIWDDLVRCLPSVCWKEIVEFRRNYVGSAEEAARFIIASEKERQYRDRQGSRGYFDSHMAHTMHQHMAYTQPVYPCQRYAQIHSPPQVIPQPYQQHVLKPQDLYPPNGYHYPPLNSYQNGYSQSHPTPPYSIPTTVPTGKLIELDSSPVHQPSLVPPHLYDSSAEFFSSKAKNDGVGAWEDWDSVYKNLHSYHKTNGRDFVDHRDHPVESRLSTQMRGISLARPTTPPNRYENNTQRGETDRPRPKKNSSDDDATSSRRLTKKENVEPALVEKNHRPRTLFEPAAAGDNVSQRQDVFRSVTPKASTEISTLTIDVVDSSVRPRPVTPQKSPSPGNGTRHVDQPSPSLPRESKASPPREQPPPRPNIVTLDVSESFLRDVSPRVELPPEKKWQCSYCTYYNEERRNACDMCSKSRRREGIEPYPRGGKECPACTLVNEKNRNFCSACTQPLKGSPTYV